MKIKLKFLLVFLLISLIPLILVFLISIYSFQKELEDSIATHYIDLAKEKANSIDFIIRNRVSEVKRLVAMPVIKSAILESNLTYIGKSDKEITDTINKIDKEWIESKGTTEVANQILNSNVSLFLKEYQDEDPKKYGDIFATDVKGATVSMTKVLTDYYQADEGWWKHSFDKGRGKVFIDHRGYDVSVGALVLGIVVPVKDNGGVIGILKINYKIREIMDVVSAVHVGETSESFLLTSQGKMVAYSGGFPREEPTEPEKALLNKEAAGWNEDIHRGRKTIEVFSPIGSELFTRVPSPGAIKGISGERWEPSKWYIFLEIEQDEAFAPIKMVKNIFVGVVFLVATIVILLAFFIARSIANPIERLARGADIIGKGNLEHKIDIKTKDELGDLAASFNKMTEDLQETTVSRDLLLKEVEERKQAEEELKNSEKKYHSLFENMLDGFAYCKMLFDDDGTPVDFIYLDINDAFEHLTGLKRENVVGKRVTEAIPTIKETHQELFDIYGRVAMTGKSTKFEIYFKPLEIWLHISVYSQKKGHFVAIFDNITERKEAENLIKESEEKFRKISSSAADAMLMMDNDGNISFWNEAAQKIFSYTAKDAIGKELAATICPECYRDAHRKGFHKFRETGKGPLIGKTLELVAVRRDGSEFPIELSIAAVKLKDKWNAIGIIRDITERKATDEKIKHHIEQLAALRSIDKAIAGSLDLSITLDIIIEQTISLLNVDAANILLYKPHLETLEYAAGRGFNTQALQYTKLKIGDSHAGQAALEQRVVHTTDLRANREGFKRSKHLAEEGFISYYGAPLIAKGVIKGVLEVFNRNVRDREQEWVDFLESLAGQAAIAIDSATLFDNLQRANIDLILSYDETIEGWSRALDLRDKETEGHSQRVTELTLRIAQAMGISETEQAHMRRGALLHDIGKMGIPDNILLKPGPLDDEEWEIMRRHPILAHELLFPAKHLRPALDIPYCHHEKWDGTGYPQGLKGEQIPLAARIFAVIDIYDALCSERPYRPAWPKEKALEEICSLAGRHLDPKVVEVFLKMDKEAAI
jgi:PAS domain S-box-containing protein